MTSKKILVVDDEPDIRELLEITISRMGLTTESAADLASAHAALKRQDFDLCLTDMNLPDGDGLDLVRKIQEEYSSMPVAVITAYGSVETAISALKSGAFDFVSKPIELDRLRGLVETALKIPSGDASIAIAEETQLLGESEGASQLRNQIAKLARSEAPVYISGESGSGKELVARLIHANSPRAAKPFIAVNCGAIPTELMESEFFGHAKGSFTGAVADKLGLFQAAEGGTLFLDEVADLPLDMQVKLLRAVQEKSVRVIGDSKEIAVDVRILSATHKNLEQEVSSNRFRQDLFYRINVIELRVPALRERREDIRVIGQQVLKDISGQSASLSDEAWDALNNYAFPGNIRELQNILERACALSENSTIEAEELKLNAFIRPAAQTTSNHSGERPDENDIENTGLYAPLPADTEFDSLDDYLQQTEIGIIKKALEKTRWNKTAAAELLGISFRALRYKLKKLDIN